MAVIRLVPQGNNASALKQKYFRMFFRAIRRVLELSGLIKRT